MRMKKIKLSFRKFIATMSVAVMIFAMTPLSASAASCVINGCYKSTYSAYQGQLKETETHKYGGFLGFAQKTCTITKTYNKYAITCGSGHVNGTSRSLSGELHSSSPDCY